MPEEILHHKGAIATIPNSLSDKEIREEWAKRLPTGNAADYQIPCEVARQALDDAAQLFRKLGRYDMAHKMDEIKQDYVG